MICDCLTDILLVVRLDHENGISISDRGDRGNDNLFFPGDEVVEEAVRGGVGGMSFGR